MRREELIDRHRDRWFERCAALLVGHDVVPASVDLEHVANLDLELVHVVSHSLRGRGYPRSSGRVPVPDDVARRSADGSKPRIGFP